MTEERPCISCKVERSECSELRCKALRDWAKKKTEPNVVLAVMALGVLLFLFGAQLQTFTNTDINYSAFGGFLFLVGLILFAINRPKKRRG